MSFRRQLKPNVKIEIAAPQVLTQSKTKKSYSSYINSELSRSRNIIMNGLNADTGYPEPILLRKRGGLSAREAPAKNYLQINIKKMVEAAPEHAKPKEIEMDRQQPKYDPTRMFSAKLEQYNLKAQTRIYLNKEFVVPKESKEKSKPLKKLEAALHLNDPITEVQRSFSNQNSHREKRAKSRQNSLLRFTQCFIMKRSVTNKKKAYQQVFGDDVGAVQYYANPRPASSVYNSINYEPQSKPVPRTRKKKMTEDSSKFKKIISKLDSMHMVFEGKAQRADLDQQVQLKHAAQQQQARILKTQQDQMLQKVRSFVQKDKNNKFKNNYTKIRNIEDLKMVDPDFLLELKRHKQKRLLKMRCDLMMFDSVRTEVGFDSKSNTYYESSQEYLNTEINRIRQAPSMKDASIYIQRPNIEQLRQIEISQHKMTRAEKILDFLRFFFRTKQQGQRFGIPLNLLYEGMYMHPQPYQLEGSYLFFQAIKHKDIQTVKSIIKVQDLSVFQIDDMGRTPLRYATQLDLVEVVQLLIKKGVNLNATCFQGKNSLYYAIANNNAQIVFQLLYKGCSPWSGANCNLSQVINRTNNPTIKSLIQLARRISIILRITPYKLRAQCWQQEKESFKRVLSKSRQQ